MAAMAAQPSGEGGQLSVSPTFRVKSFSALFSSQQRTPMAAAVSTHRGEPAVSFARDVIETVAQPFCFTLVSKFSRNRPRMEDIKRFFLSLDLKGSFSIGLLDSRHVLIRLHIEEDFLRVWTRAVWYIADNTMRVFKWTPSFHVDKESSLASIVSCLGRPLFIDAATVALSHPSVARVCVKIDLLKELPPRVWLQLGEDHGFWQPLQPESMPKYCVHCYRQGHNQLECHVKNPELRPNVVHVEKKLPPGENNGSPRVDNMVELDGVVAAEGSYGDGEVWETGGQHAEEEIDVGMHEEGAGEAGQVQEVGEEAGHGQDVIEAAVEFVEHAVVAAADRIIVGLTERMAIEAAPVEGEGRDAPPGVGDHAVLGEEEAAGVLATLESITCAGGLSSWGTEEQHGEGEETCNAAMTLNLDQVAILEQSCQMAERQQLWEGLLQDKPGQGPWYVVGDFNLVLSSSEKKGGRQFRPAEGLCALRLTMLSFSSRSRLELLLGVDRSDLDVVMTAWQLEVSGSPFSVVWGKLRNVSPALHIWNKQVFGDVFENVKKGEEVVAAVELRAQADLSVEAQLELQRAQANLKRLLAVEEQFWSQKTRLKWLQHNDRNSSYFHLVVKQRHFQSTRFGILRGIG
ncbi:uncharacterized protein LOC113759869 [Coffea eugenioides]|uniref:uncharacterized protein LOC113759869 n=1 Tax=Coffea eugenioides TaxID=49369 RepID=UPI000F609BB7|nr:uncharacterized protein LOC113759869 [Coffea eugenioides]